MIFSINFCEQGDDGLKQRTREHLDRLRYNRILKMTNRHKKEYYNEGGCGLEIEFAVEYEPRCRVYIGTGLQKLKDFVGSRGKFTTDPSIGSFLNVEIVLRPFPRDELHEIFSGIVDILSFYENFKFTDHCGVHATFRAEADLKKAFYEILTDGRYDSSRFRHNKYKADFMKTATTSSGCLRSYEEYITYQEKVGTKYCGVNFLKAHLVEIRTLNLDWDDVSFFYDAYEEAEARIAAQTAQ